MRKRCGCASSLEAGDKDGGEDDGAWGRVAWLDPAARMAKAQITG